MLYHKYLPINTSVARHILPMRSQSCPGLQFQFHVIDDHDEMGEKQQKPMRKN